MIYNNQISVGSLLDNSAMVFTGESNRIPVEKKYFKRKSHGAAFIIEAITFVKENRFNSIIEKDGS